MATQTKKTEIKSFEILDETSGEIRPRFKYMVGQPRQYRFNGQNGRFNLDGITDKGTSLEIIPIAWRVFTADNLFGRERLEKWAEVFFIDADNCVSAIMFNNTSANIFNTLLAQLMYADLTLIQVKLTITADRRTNSAVASNYYIAQFNFQPADPDTIRTFLEYTQHFPIYRADTITDSETLSLSSVSYRPILAPQEATLLERYAQNYEEENK